MSLNYRIWLNNQYVRPAPVGVTNPVYVAAGVAPGGTGSDVNPWEINESRGAIQAGDDASYKGEFTEQNSFIRHAVGGGTSTPSGTVTQWIRHKQWLNEAQAILHGDPVTYSCVNIGTQIAYVVIEGLHLLYTGTAGVPNSLGGESHDVYWFDLLVKGAGIKFGVSSADGGHYNGFLDGLTFDEIGDTSSNSGDALFFINGATGQKTQDITVARSTILRCGHALSTVGGVQAGSGPNGPRIRFVLVKGRNPWAGGFNNNWEAFEPEYLGCDVYECGIDNIPGIGSRNAILVQGVGGKIYGCCFWDCQDKMVTIEVYGASQISQDWHIAFNTIYNGPRSKGYAAAGVRWLCNIADANVAVTGHLVENNAIWVVPGEWQESTTHYPFTALVGGGGTPWTPGTFGGTIVRNNLTGTDRTPEQFFIGPEGEMSLATAEATFAGWGSNVFPDDPEFVNVALLPNVAQAFALQATSPARAMANPLVLGPNLRHDVGAFEYGVG